MVTAMMEVAFASATTPVAGFSTMVDLSVSGAPALTLNEALLTPAVAGAVARRA